MNILDKARRMLERHPLCDHCLGRQFALLGYNLDNQKRGESIKVMLTMKGHQLISTERRRGLLLLKTLAVNGSFGMASEILKKMRSRFGKGKECYLCGGRITLLGKLTEKAIEALKDYEYTTFLVGIKLPIEVEEAEDEFKAMFKVKHGENIRNEFSREIGKRISRATEKETDYRTPDIVVIVNPFNGLVTLQVNPFFIGGKYIKLIPEIPQSNWICRECGGDGCSACGGTGKMYEESVEEIIATPILEKTHGENTIFHSSGRVNAFEDERPFIVEIKKPIKRFIDFQDLMKTINEQGKVKVFNLYLVRKNDIGKTKNKVRRTFQGKLHI